MALTAIRGPKQPNLIEEHSQDVTRRKHDVSILAAEIDLRSREASSGKDNIETLQAAEKLGGLYLEGSKRHEYFALAVTWDSRLPTMFDDLNVTGDHDWFRGAYKHASAVFRHELQDREIPVGASDLLALNAAYSLATIYLLQGKVGKLVRLTSTWGSKEHRLFDKLHSLGLISMKEGNIIGARFVFQSELHGRESTLGKYHESTIAVRKFLGLCQKQGYNTGMKVSDEAILPRIWAALWSRALSKTALRTD